MKSTLGEVYAKGKRVSLYISAIDTKGTGDKKGRVSTIPMIHHAEVILHSLFVQALTDPQML